MNRRKNGKIRRSTPQLCILISLHRKLGRLEFLKNSKDAIEPFYMVRAVAKPDKFYKRLKMDILDQETSEKLASCYGKRGRSLVAKTDTDALVVMLASVLFHKKHLRQKDPEFFSTPILQAGFWDLRDGGTETAENFVAGQVRMHTGNNKRTCEELEELVEMIIEGSRDEQRRFLIEASVV